VDRILIEIRPDNTVWVETEGLTRTGPKLVRYRDLVKVMVAGLDDDEEYGFDLPHNCVYHKIAMRGGSILRSRFVLFRDAHIRQIRYYDTEYTVPMPACLFRVILEDDRIESVGVVAVLSDYLQDDTPVYRFPYGNLIGSELACFGRNPLPRIETPRQLSGISDYYFDLPFGEGSRELIAGLNGREKFPEELLLVVGNYKTFKDKEVY
jgi:hypothetical protein